MKSGVSFPSYTEQTTFGLNLGTADPDFPVANLSDLVKIRRLFRADAPGAVTINFIMPAAQRIGFMALVHHNAVAGQTFRLRLYNNATPGVGSPVYDSNAQQFFPFGTAPDPDYPHQVRPFDFSAVTCRSGLIDLSAGAQAWSLGGVEIGDFWEWQDVAVPREFGIASRDVVVEMPLASEQGMAQWSPRTVAGSRGSIDLSAEENTALDFFREKGLGKPFVWAWDLDDPATWNREAFLVTNSRLPAPVRGEYLSGSFSFALKEHLR